GDTTRGVYTFDVKQAFVKDGDTFKLKLATVQSPDSWAEITLTAKNTGVNEATGALAGTFNIGSTDNIASAEQQAANIAEALKHATWDIDGSGADITSIYDVSYNGSSIILTEKAALGPQAGVENGSFTVTNAV